MSKKQRKYETEHIVQGRYGHGWEDLTTEPTRKEAIARRREYDANSPGHAHRVIARRVRVEPLGADQGGGGALLWAGLAAVGLAAGVGGYLFYINRRDRVLTPTYTIPVQPDKLNALDKALLEQALLRLAMTKAPLPPADMQRAYDLAIKAELPRTAATLKSIMTDNAIGGPTYVPLPTNEGWPGTNVAVRNYVSQKLAALQTQTAAARA